MSPHALLFGQFVADFLHGNVLRNDVPDAPGTLLALMLPHDALFRLRRFVGVELSLVEQQAHLFQNCLSRRLRGRAESPNPAQTNLFRQPVQLAFQLGNIRF